MTALNYEYYQQAFYGRINPDGCPVSSTYYMSHEYTDYSKVGHMYIHVIKADKKGSLYNIK